MLPDCQRHNCWNRSTHEYGLCEEHFQGYQRGDFTVSQPKYPEQRTVSATGGEKIAKEEQAHHIPWAGLRELYRVGSFGAEKYEDYNFRKGFPWSLSYDAAHRHLNIWWEGEGFYDEESPKTGKWWRIHHLANAAWHCLVLLFFEATGKYHQYDDRPWVSDIKRQLQEAYNGPMDRRGDQQEGAGYVDAPGTIAPS